MTGAIHHLVVGPSTHGVVRYAVDVFEELNATYADHSIARFGTAVEAAAHESELVHVHVTDRLFGSSARDAAGNFRAMVDTVGRPVSVTLHDLPQPSDGPSMADRVHFYRSVLDLVVGVAVSSEHEAALLRDHVDDDIVAEVVPLMIDRPALPPAYPQKARSTVGVLGFLYPGKGHIETVQAMNSLPDSVGFVALGTPSPGHDDLAEELYSAASICGRPCEVTGFLGDDELRRRMWEISVPVAFHRHMSASGSINSWISAGRRPLVPRTGYVEELDSRSPGVVSIHDNDENALREAITASLADPRTTWIAPSVRPVPSGAEVAARYDTLLRGWCP